MCVAAYSSSLRHDRGQLQRVLQNAIKMSQTYIKAYGITTDRLQVYLQGIFPGCNITVNVSAVRLIPLSSRHFLQSKAFHKVLSTVGKTPNE